MRVDELADGGIDGRPRAQELSSSLKVIPYIDHAFTEWHGFQVELNNFLLLYEFNLDAVNPDRDGSSLEKCKYLLLDRNVDERLPIQVNFTCESPEDLFLLFIYATHVKCSDEEISELIKAIAAHRWSDLETPIVGMTFAVLRAALLVSYGPSDSNYSVAPTPTDYEAFRQNMTMRYPSANPPPSDIPSTAYSAFELPKRLMQPILGVSEVPKSIQEACEIFRERVQTRKQFTQFWEEHEILTRTKAGGIPELSYTKSLYTICLPYLKSFFTVFVHYVLRRGVSKEEPSGLRAALGAVYSIISNCSHVLEEQFMYTVLFDLQFHLVAFKVSALNPVLDSVLQPNPEPTWSPWGKTPQRQHKRTHSRAASTTDGICIEQFSVSALETLVLLIRILRLSITDRPQRIAITAELPATPLKQLMSMYNDDLWSEILLVFKLQASLNGRKWRTMNMEIISAIYIHCPFKLDDDWLTGGDAVSEVRAPAVTEETLRELIELYNATRRVPEEVKVNGIDQLSHELSSATNLEFPSIPTSAAETRSL